MFSPDVVPALWGQSEHSKKGINQNPPAVTLQRHDVRESMSDNSSESRRPVRKSSARSLASLFRRKKRDNGGVYSGSQLSIVWSSEHEEDDATDVDERPRLDEENLSQEAATGESKDTAGDFGQQSK